MRYYLFLIGLALLVASCGYADKRGGLQALNTCISDSNRQANCVYLTSDENDQPVISWCETDKASDSKGFYMAFFNQQDSKFSDRINIPFEQNANLHEEGMPKLAFKGDGTIIAIYEVETNSEKNRFAGAVKYLVSTDKGRSWTQPAFLHADTSQDNSHSYAAITTLSDGEVGACWLDQSFDQKVGGRPVKFAKTNPENRFQNELIIDSVACQCCRIAMSGDNGKIAVAFRDIINDSIRDMSVSSSDDNGKTFTSAIPFSNDNWIINGCPHNGPSLALSGSSVYAAWFTGGQERGVYYGELNDKKEMVNKQLLSVRGRFVQLCLLKDGSRILVYNENVQGEGKSYNKIVLTRFQHDKEFAEEIKTEKSMAGYPVVRAFGTDKLVVAWTSNEKVYYTVVNANDIVTSINTRPVNTIAQTFSLPKMKLANSNDPVCGMPLSLSPGDTTLFRQKVYGFCSAVCKNHFVQKPEAFVKK